MSALYKHIEGQRWAEIRLCGILDCIEFLNDGAEFSGARYQLIEMARGEADGLCHHLESSSLPKGDEA